MPAERGQTTLATLSLWSERLFNQPLLADPWAAAAVAGVLAERLGIAEVLVPSFGELHRFDPGFLAGAAFDEGPSSLREYEVADGVAVIPVTGKLVNRSAMLRPMSGMTGYNAIGDTFDMAMADPEVRGIALEIDSPGGEAAGAFDLWRRIADARGTKPIWSIVYNQAASSGYGLASAADRIVAPEFGAVGSIGVVGMHADLSGALAQKGVKVTVLHSGARKAEGNPYEGLTADVAARWQDKLDQLYERFVQMTASHRKMTQKAVRATEGEVLYGREAKDVGLVDALAAPHEALAEFTQFINRGVGKTSRSAKGMGMTAQTSGAAGMTAPDANDTTALHAQISALQGQLSAARHELGEVKAGHLELNGQIAEAREQTRMAYAKGGADQLARVSTILRSEAAAGRMDTAMSLALDTDLAAEPALKVLASTPKVEAVAPAVPVAETAARTTDFAAHMDRLGNPKVGAEADEPDEIDQVLVRMRKREGRA